MAPKTHSHVLFSFMFTRFVSSHLTWNTLHRSILPNLLSVGELGATCRANTWIDTVQLKKKKKRHRSHQQPHLRSLPRTNWTRGP